MNKWGIPVGQWRPTRLALLRPGAVLVLSAYCLVLTVTTGCVRRTLTIQSDPPGAKVYLNDQLKGDTPVSFDPVWYGWYRVMLRKDGYQRLDDRRQLRAPFYLWIPFDFVMEILPVPIPHKRTWTYTLTPMEALPTPKPPAVGSAPAPTPESDDAAR